MNKIKCLSIFILIFLLQISMLVAQSRTAEVNYAGETEQGTILLEVVGYGNGWEKAIEEAEKKAFEVLLFQGLPSSKQDKPFVENEIESRQNNEGFYKDFFENKKYNNFLMKITSQRKPKKVRGKKQSVFYFKINTDALRKNLEQNKIIRKFGF